MNIYSAIGLMSGTSMDGIDLALIESDGKKIINRKFFEYQPYSKEFKQRLSYLIYGRPTLEEIKQIELELTNLHADFVNNFIENKRIDRKKIDLIAFHGHTIYHNSSQNITWQIGNAHLLKNQTKIKVVADFRSNDVSLGGQGAPLVPIYHFYLFANQKKPCAVLNIGGISNITYFSNEDENNIEAFDVCFGNAPFDDLMKEKLNLDFDLDGNLSKKGIVNIDLANQILQNEIFYAKPPKSYDRNDFSNLISPIKNLKIEDALATLAYMHARAIKINLDFFNQAPKELFVCGGGRNNLAIMDELKKQLEKTEVKSVEEIELDGSSIEAEAFAFLGIRRLLNLPISFPKTTGIKVASIGGVMHQI